MYDNAGETQEMSKTELMVDKPDPMEIKLAKRLTSLKIQAEDVEKAIKVLNENPNILEALNCLRRVGI